jgi:hypothetical protein
MHGGIDIDVHDVADAGVVYVGPHPPPRPAIPWTSTLPGALLLVAIAFGVLFALLSLLWALASAPRGTPPLPSQETSQPLTDLEKLAQGFRKRHETTFRVLLAFVIAVGVVLFAVLGWAMYMVSRQQALYGTLFGTGGVGTGVLSQWKWQPFDRMNEARRAADDAAVLGAAIGLRLATIGEIKDPDERQKKQWEAAKDFLEENRKAAQPTTPAGDPPKKKGKKRK